MVDERTEGETRKLYVDPESGDSSHLDAVRKAFDGPEAIYIMVMDLDDV